MKKRKISIKTIVFVLLYVFFCISELIFDIEYAKKTTGLIAVVLIAWDVIEFFWDSFTMLKQDKDEDEAEP